MALQDTGTLRAAVEVAEEVLTALDGPAAPGVVQPGRVLADVHQVLEAAGDPRAENLAHRAGAYLQEQSGRILDDDLRARFLAAPVSTRLAKVAASVAHRAISRQRGFSPREGPRRRYPPGLRSWSVPAPDAATTRGSR